MAWLSRVVLLTVVLLGGCNLFDSESKNSSLSNLSISAGSLNPAFSAGVTSYSVDVGAAVETLTIFATAQDGKALVSINGGSGGRGSDSATVPLAAGSNSISVIVSAEERARQTTYTITVLRPVPAFSIGGTVSGLDGGLVLQNNGGEDLAISADGAFKFPTPVDDGSTYNVTVAEQPAGQECTVTDGSGTVSGADVTDISVECTASTFTVGGTLSGLNDSITLQNNGADDLVLTEDGAFTFPTALDDGATYDVTISVQPTGQECRISNGSGTIDGADVTNVIVDCGEPAAQLVGGVVDGLAGTITLQLNGSINLLVVSDGTFTFFDRLSNGESYDVTVLTQPVDQTCAVSGGSGVIGDGNELGARVDCTGAGVTTGSVFEWEWIDPTPQGNMVADFASNGTVVVATSGAGLVQTSMDGINWTMRDVGTGNMLGSVAWGDNKFVVAGESSILTSPDGVTWQLQRIGFNSLAQVIWTGSQFVGVGAGTASASSFGPVVATSPDGNTWSFRQISQEQAFLRDVAWNGSLLTAIQLPNTVLTSPDGIDWTATQLGDSNTFLSQLESDGSGFLVATNNRQVYTSPDGTTWTLQAESIPLTSPGPLEWDGSRFVALGQTQMATSPDGSAWAVNEVGTATVPGPITAPRGLSSFIRHAGQNIIGHVNGAISTSPDDTSWTTPHSNMFGALSDVIWEDNQFVAVGAGPSVLTSPDGVTWTTRYEPSLIQAFAPSIVRGGGQYVVVGQGPSEQVLTSSDGITWTPLTLSTEFLDLQNVAWGNNQFIAVGGGAVWTSPDGTTWTDRSSNLPDTDILTDVEWTGSTWVAIGLGTADFGAQVWTSPDGIEWTLQTAVATPPGLAFENLAWSGSRFVAAGFGVIGTSPDGLNWSVSQTNGQFHNVFWSGSEFLLSGASPYLLSSTDGTSWSVRRTLSMVNDGVASDGSTTVLVGILAQIVLDSGSGGP